MSCINKDKLVSDVLRDSLNRCGYQRRTIQIKWSSRMTRALGTARLSSRGSIITLSKRFFDNIDNLSILENTVRHEAAHIVTFWEHGFNVASHGKEWQMIAKKCGLANPERLNSDKEIMEIYKKNQRKNAKLRFIFLCSCEQKEWFLKKKHMKEQTDGTLVPKHTFFCQNCKQILQFKHSRYVF